MLQETRKYTAEEIKLIRDTVAKEATDLELKTFIAQCERTGLDPMNRQIYLIKRSGKCQTQPSVDGFRLVAERTGKYEGQTAEFWCGGDGVWKDVWLGETPPSAAKVGVWKSGSREPTWAVATLKEYSAGGPMWTKMPARMLLKVAESLALRKAFPQELSGLYTIEEMDQAGSVDMPQAQPESPRAEPAKTDALSEAQIKRLHAIGGKLFNLSGDALTGRINEAAAKIIGSEAPVNVTALSRSQGSAVMKSLEETATARGLWGQA